MIADNVGDNVGDVAGMGADIFESYVGSMIATIAIAATLQSDGLRMLAGSGGPEQVKAGLMAFPLALSAAGLIASLLGIGSMQAFKIMGPAAALRYSAWLAALLFLGAGYGVVLILGLNPNIVVLGIRSSRITGRCFSLTSYLWDRRHIPGTNSSTWFAYSDLFPFLNVQ